MAVPNASKPHSNRLSRLKRKAMTTPRTVVVTIPSAINRIKTFIATEGGLRYAAEFARHKLLDAIGDLYCVGHPLLAAYSAFRSGHALNNRLLRELLARPDAYELVTFEDERQAPTGFAQLARAW